MRSDEKPFSLCSQITYEGIRREEAFHIVLDAINLNLAFRVFGKNIYLSPKPLNVCSCVYLSLSLHSYDSLLVPLNVCLSKRNDEDTRAREVSKQTFQLIKCTWLGLTVGRPLRVLHMKTSDKKDTER